MIHTFKTQTLSKELRNRTAALQSDLQTHQIDAALLVQNSDLYYFAGTIQQSHLWIPIEGKPLLMVRKSLPRAQSESGVQRIVALQHPQNIPDALQRQGYPLPRRVGMELDVLPTARYFNYRDVFSAAEIVDVSQQIRLIRAVKSEFELEMIRQAAHRADQVAASVPDMIREGIPEIELAGLVEAKARQLGHQGVIRMRLWGAELFYGHLMAGPSAAVPSYLASPTGGAAVSSAVAQGPSFRPIRGHEPILVDYVFTYNGYIADHARIYSIGPLSDKLMRAHQDMLSLQKQLKKSAKAGICSGDVYAEATEKAAAMGYQDNFMGADTERIKFVGHGVGIELDEYPFLAQGQKLILQAGMTLALEPKLIFPGYGVVGIENTHLVTDNGLEQLTLFEETVIEV